jgi:hypothetical protein
MDLRFQKGSLEDRISHLSDDFMVLQTKNDNLQTLCRQLEKGRDDAVDAQAKLRAELKAMQQSVSATFRLEHSMVQSGGAPPTNSALLAAGDLDAAMRLNEAKAEAKVRQLTNKLEFLKAQLASEQATNEELRSTANKEKLRLDEIRSEFRLKMQEADRLKEEAVADAERRVELGFEDRMRELTTLQAKMMSVQGQLKDAYDETSLARQREESARATVAKSQAQMVALKTEIQQLRDQLNLMREEKEQELAKAGAKQNQDAALRRLENERQYLKSQLASEITLKNELQEAMFQCQQQLVETQAQWKSDVEALKETTAQTVRESTFAQQRLHQTAISLEAEVARLNAHNTELKEGFVKMRDQVRVEQLAIEDTSTTNRRLLEQIESMRKEISKMKEAEEQQAAAHERQIEALNTLLSEQEQRAQREMLSLRDELSRQYSTNSNAQSEALMKLKAFDSERKAFGKQLGAARIIERFRKLMLVRNLPLFYSVIFSSFSFHPQQLINIVIVIIIIVIHTLGPNCGNVLHLAQKYGTQRRCGTVPRADGGAGARHACRG